jgi:hypothetical protein
MSMRHHSLPAASGFVAFHGEQPRAAFLLDIIRASERDVKYLQPAY